MKIQIRKGVFETNSSSCHSLSYTRSSNYNIETAIKDLLDIDGYLDLSTDSFAESDTYIVNLEDKIMYCTTIMLSGDEYINGDFKKKLEIHLEGYLNMLRELFPEIQGFHLGGIDKNNYDTDECDELLMDKYETSDIIEAMKKFLCDEKTLLILDN